MDLKLKGKRALVTGASQGIGIDIAKLFAQEGVAVAVNGRNGERTERTVKEIEAAGGRAVTAIGDITTDEGANAVADAALKGLGGVDILVNNAGGLAGTGVKPWQDIAIKEYFDSYNLNLVAGVRLALRLTPAMMERGWGRIINISSAIARQGMGMMHDYAAAKLAVENLSLNMSLNLAPHGVTVNTVTPGLILTPVSRDYIEKLRDQHGWSQDEAEMQKSYIAEFAPQPIPRLGKTVEVANAVVFLCSPLSDYTTGAVLRVDGGMIKGV